MDLNIIIEEGKKDLGIHSNLIEINVIVNSISDIYPKISKKYKKLLKFEHAMYDKYNEFGMDVIESYDTAIEILKQKIKDGNCKITIKSINHNCFKRINEVFPNGCIIDITMIDDDDVNSLLNNNEFNDKIKFKDKYNSYSFLSYEEVLNSYKLINGMKQEIAKYNLTPLEQVILLYDKVRKKPYKDYDEDLSASRDINEILNNEYVVCEGYANIISAVCNALNIDCDKMIWNPIKGNFGHATNLVYINDDYYNVHQFFEIDATMCTKCDENDHEYINNYKYLLFPLETAINLKEKKYGLLFKGNLDVKTINDRYERMKKLFILNAPDSLKESSVKLFLELILNIVKKTNNKDLKISYEKAKEQLKNDPFAFEIIESLYQKYQEMTKKKMKKDVIIEALYKVKRIEYLINPNECKLDINLFKDMIENNFPSSKEEKLLDNIFGINSCFVNINFLKNLMGNDQNERAKIDIDRIKLLKILKDELEAKKSKVNVKK